VPLTTKPPAMALKEFQISRTDFNAISPLFTTPVSLFPNAWLTGHLAAS
jgi:hypothetical protein